MADLKNLPGSHDFRPGLRRISAQDLNDLRESAIRQIIGSPPIQVNKFGNRCSIAFDSKSIIPPPLLQRFVVLTEYDDLLVCAFFSYGTNVQTYSPDTLGDVPADQQMYVAKPYLLQKSPWQGRTVVLRGRNYTFDYATTLGHRTAAIDGETPEDQVIDLPYFPGDIITAQLGPTGYSYPTGEFDEDETAIYTQVPWMDINEGGRHWSPATVVTSVSCESGDFSKTQVTLG